ncbi:MAG: DUF5615 family PIN-like protein [Nitrospirota bacterium]
MDDIHFLANMNISPKTVEALRQQGLDIVRVSQLLPVNAADEQILDFARREDMIVVTQDMDFSSLLALGGYNRPSLITIRMSLSDPESVAQKLLDVLPSVRSTLQEGCAITIEDVAVRIRRLPIE